MKKKCHFLFLLMVCSVPVFSIEDNSLKDACGYVALTQAHIKGMESWQETSEICLGADFLHHSSHALTTTQGQVLFSQHETLNDLAAISFDDLDDINYSGELIAENSALNQGKIVQVSALPKLKPSVTAMGVSKNIR